METARTTKKRKTERELKNERKEEEGEIVGKTRTEVKATAGNSLLALLHAGPMLRTESEEMA